MFQKVLVAGVVAFLLLFLPLGAAAQEGEVRAAGERTVLDWMVGLWNDFAAWVAPDSFVDGSCAIDPDGCPGGAAAPAQPAPGAGGEGTCAVDPDGCPGGA